MTLVNNSPLNAEVRLGFLVDAVEDSFSVSPRQLFLKPGESGLVTMWAFPRIAKRFEDSLVCSVKDNPKTTVFKVACDGTLPELVLDKKAFNFEKVLLQRWVWIDFEKYFYRFFKFVAYYHLMLHLLSRIKRKILGS